MVPSKKEPDFVIRWQDITPHDARFLDLTIDLGITAPLNEKGERCPWPWVPQQLDISSGDYYTCQFCGVKCLAGTEHFDYREDDK